MDQTLKNVLFFAAKVVMIDSLALAFLVDSVMVYMIVLLQRNVSYAWILQLLNYVALYKRVMKEIVSLGYEHKPIMELQMLAWGIEDYTFLKKILLVLLCVVLFCKIVRHMFGLLKEEKEPITVLVTGAAGMNDSVFSNFPLIVFYLHIFDSFK